MVELLYNVGKGGALHQGLMNASSDVVLLLDADLIGLTPQHVIDLVEPVMAQEADVAIGIFEDGRFATDFAQKLLLFSRGREL